MNELIEQYCDEHKLDFTMIENDEYYDFVLYSYTNDMIEDFKNIIKDKGHVKEEYECVGTNDIQRRLRLFVLK